MAERDKIGDVVSVPQIYVAKIPFDVRDTDIVPPMRAEAIASCADERARRSKFYVWKLLEYGLMHAFGLRMGEREFTVSEHGKWLCRDCEFSLTHSGELVAVALSRQPIGIDAERWQPERFTSALCDRILTQREKTALLSIAAENRSGYVNRLWTIKEAVYKCGGTGTFSPAKVETEDAYAVTKRIRCGEKTYLLTVVLPDVVRADFHALDVTVEDFPE